jgi:hypothetical protein
VVRGSGRPQASCGGPLLVSEHETGRRPLARVTPGGFPISWGFFPDSERAWVHAEAKGVKVEGFAATAEETFSIRGEVPVLTGHVWVKDGAPIRVRRGVEAGVLAVSVRGDIAGTDAHEWKVSCDVIGYDPLPTRARSLGRRDGRERGRVVRPRGNRLRLHAAPETQAFGTLTTTGEVLQLPLQLHEVLGDWSRVRFETYHLRYDAWVRSDEVASSSGGVGTGMGWCAAAPPVPGPEERATVVIDMPLGLGPSLSAVSRGLSIAAGTEVGVDSRENGFVKVFVPGPIAPPPEAAFFLPESALATLPR